MKRLNILNLFIALCFTMTAVAEGLSENRRKLFEGFNDNPRQIIKKLHDFYSHNQQTYENAAKIWFTLHLQVEDSWERIINQWPDDIDFADFVNNSQVVSLESENGASETGFLAFHRLPDYERLNEIYQDPYSIQFATGVELMNFEAEMANLVENNQDQQEKKMKSMHTLRAQLTKNLLDLYGFIEHVTEEITKVRLELEIAKDQVTALDFGKNNGYYIRFLSPESSAYVISLPDQADELLKALMKLRTEVILKAHHQISGMIHAVSLAQYNSTTDFKKDLKILINDLQSATPHLTSFGRRFGDFIKKLDQLEERRQLARTHSQEQNQELVDHIQQLFAKLKGLVQEEKSKLNVATDEKQKAWLEWLEKHQSDYAQVFFELYEVLEYPSEPGTPLYEFQVKYFHLNSPNRIAFRNLEALLFGNSEVGSLNKVFNDKDRVASKAKFRSSLLDRMFLSAGNCHQALAN